MKTKIQNIFIFMSMISISGCQQAAQVVDICTLPEEYITVEQQNADGAESDQNSEEPRECDIPAKASNANISINATLLKFKPEEEEKMRDALVRLEIILESEEFRQRVFAHTYKEEQTFVDNEGYTNSQVYDIIMDGAETLQPEVDHEIDLEIELYYSSKNVVGYTYPNVNKIWVNKKFFRSNSPGKVAANVAHEWTHKLGFGHDFKRTAKRPYSVPYGVGSIIRELVDGM